MREVLLAVTLVFLQGQQPQHVLDLSRVVPPDRGELVSEVHGCVEGTAGERLMKPPLRIDLERLNRPDYVLGGQVIFDVLITNTGSVPVAFPWAKRGDIKDMADPETLREASLALMTSDRDGHEHVLSAAILQGSAKHPGTLREIGPGEVARIRVPGWLMSSEKAIVPLTDGAARETEFFAQLRVSDAPCHWSRAIRSQGIPVLLGLAGKTR